MVSQKIQEVWVGEENKETYGLCDNNDFPVTVVLERIVLGYA